MKYRLDEKTNVYSTASSTSQVVTELQVGDEIDVGEITTNDSGRWHNVKLQDG